MNKEYNPYSIDENYVLLQSIVIGMLKYGCIKTKCITKKNI